MSEEIKRARRRVVTGVVISDKMNRTIVIEVQRTILHPKFKKYIRRRTRHYAHDEKSEAGIGDTVQIMETRPVSKTKSFRLVKVISKARIPATTPKVESIEPEIGGEAKS